ncbi:hypothetical protein REH65_09020 [Saccharopolyspora sp. ID03-671]|uniref:hypothetical protein n=1 Tax=Saccharopolyspora sp. ID03-671 TaxID=3073066 RepID=UPI00324E530F
MPSRGHPAPRQGSPTRHRHRRRPGSVLVRTERTDPATYRGAETVGLTPDRRLQRHYHPADPVFVDGSGRRRRAVRRFVLLISLVLTGLVLLLAAAMLDSPTPAPPLPNTPEATR